MRTPRRSQGGTGGKGRGRRAGAPSSKTGATGHRNPAPQPVVGSPAPMDGPVGKAVGPESGLVGGIWR